MNAPLELVATLDDRNFYVSKHKVLLTLNGMNRQILGVMSDI